MIAIQILIISMLISIFFYILERIIIEYFKFKSVSIIYLLYVIIIIPCLVITLTDII